MGTLFSGIGAPEEALRELGIEHDVIFACDNDEHAKKTYLKNNQPKCFYDDINKIDLSEIEKVDLLVFGFPCQPFSFAGKGCGMDDFRGKLVIKAINILLKVKPKYFIAENVPGLKAQENGRTLKNLMKRMRNKGEYSVKYKTLDSKDFGVPQQRKRIIIVGTRNDLDVDFKFPSPINSKTVLKDVLDIGVGKRFYATRDFLKKEKVQKRLKGYDKDFINCITHTIARNGSSSEYISYVAAVNHAIGELRKPTPEECLKLHGFSDSFKFPHDVSVTARYNQVGNTMTVPVISEVINKLMRDEINE